jgi:hypothetical protein
MGTIAQKRIKETVSPNEYLKLKTIYSNLKRPLDFPADPYVAIMSSTDQCHDFMMMQDPVIDFTFTTMCFTDVLVESFSAYARPGRQPILIASKNVFDLKDQLV